MKTTNIKSLANFISLCSEFEVQDGHTLFFRGHASDEFTLSPSIFRNQDGDSKKGRYVEKEKELFHDLITNSPQEFKDCNSTFDFLVKMQHYGLPTRLLDITSNPLVALYFACNMFIPTSRRDKHAKDGQVIIFEVPNNEIKYFNSDTVSVISNLVRVEATFNFDEPKERERYVHFIRAEKPYFEDNIEKDVLRTVVCVKPKLDNPRIVKQSGAFF